MKFKKRNTPNDLYDAGAKFSFIMVRIVDKPHLMSYKSVQNDQILTKTFTPVRLMYAILGYYLTVQQNIINFFCYEKR